MPLFYFWRWLALILIGLVIYGQTFTYDFVFDDHLFIVTNPFIKNFHNIHIIWQSFPKTRLLPMYSFALNYYFNQLNAWGYHVFNFIVHLTATGLVWALAALLFRITKILPSKDRLTQELPFFIAVLFLVHPGQTQAVTYITQRFESMATVFYLATVYFYLQGRVLTRHSRQIIFFGLAGLSLILGLLTKEVILTVPAMILAAEWILFPDGGNKITYVLLGVGVVLAYVLFTEVYHDHFRILLASIPSESHDGDNLTPVRYLLTQMRVFLTFLRLLVLPIHQNLEYDYPASIGLFSPPLTVVGLGAVAGCIGLVVKLRQNSPLMAFGVAWLLITFSINLVPRANVIFEHKLYLISFGFFLFLVGALSTWVRDRGTLLRILSCIIVVLAVMSFERNKVWANELSLWQDCIKTSPNKERVNANLGRIYGSLGQYDKAIYYLSRAITINPDNITYENRGIIYSQEGKSAQALEDLNKSIAMDPKYFPTYVKRSWVYQTQHQYQAALADLQVALSLNPYFTDAFIERGMLWMQLGRYRPAWEDFQQVLKIDPFNAQARQYGTYCLARIQ